MIRIGQARQRKRDYSILFSSPEGKRVLDDLILHSGMLNSSFNSDPLILAHDEGGTDIIRYILSVLKYSPKDFISHIEEIESYERRDDGSNPGGKVDFGDIDPGINGVTVNTGYLNSDRK